MDFSEKIKIGLKNEKEETVSEANSAFSLGSGGLAVYGTPAMIALMEGAALSAVDPLLPEAFSTVGTEVNVRHLSATPLGMKVIAKAELLSIEGRALSFKVEALDEAGIIGEGTHSRFIIENEKFLGKVMNKVGKS
ncbi:MAG: thioesterase family protein [Treponema sp.]|nr:thioesterase family protein [Treponema sp.]